MTESGFWQGRSVLVTGGNGFVGSWLVQALLEHRASVTVLVRDVPSHSNLRILGLRDRVNLVFGSLTDYGLVERALNEYEVEICFHLAAQAIVGLANRSPLATFESNVGGTWNLLEACRGNRAKVVVASSDKAYGHCDQLPYVENQALNPRYPYDVSKACAELISRCYWHTFRLPVVVARCSNIYGGGDFNFSRLVPGTVRALLGGEEIIIRSDGTPVRDYLYIADAISAYLLLGERLDKVQGEVFNFGTGTPVSVLELTKKIVALCGKRVEPKVLGIACGEIDTQFISAEKARLGLGWEARCDLDEGLKRTIEWYEAYWSGRILVNPPA